MKCPILPINDKVVILPQDEGEQMYGNIVVPDTEKEKPEIGIVMVPKFGAQMVTVEGETYIIASENDVLGIIKSKENE